MRGMGGAGVYQAVEIGCDFAVASLAMGNRWPFPRAS